MVFAKGNKTKTVAVIGRVIARIESLGIFSICDKNGGISLDKVLATFVPVKSHAPVDLENPLNSKRSMKKIKKVLKQG